MFLTPNYTNAKETLINFINKGLSDYSKNRNFDNGLENRSNVSLLSPFIRKRIIHEEEVILSALKFHSYNKIEKFIQEVFWRTYWKGWLEGRPQVWFEYQNNLKKIRTELPNNNFKKDYTKAINGQTGINCFDNWVNELSEYGYLHNHARMWFASIWIFTLNLPWELGADFFYRNLLDADPASNTLSWRWVAGLHTPGKFYLAREENIEKYSNYSFKGKIQLKKKISAPIHQQINYTTPLFNNFEFDEINYFLLNPTCLSYKDSFIKKIKNKRILYIDLFSNNQDSKNKIDFNKNAISEYISFLKKNQIDVIELDDFKELTINSDNGSFSFCTPYPGIGFEKDEIEKKSKENKITVNYLLDPYDLKCWPYAKSGFFKFKNNIEKIINTFSINKNLDS